MRVPPYPCAHCGRRGLLHPSPLWAVCVKCWDGWVDRPGWWARIVAWAKARKVR